MLRQSLTRKFYSLIQFERSVGHLCASKLIKPDENLTLRKFVVPMMLRLQNANYRTKEDILKVQKERLMKANEHFALRQIFAPMIKVERKVKKKTIPKKTSRAVGHVGRLDMRVGRIVEIQKAMKAETLYLTKVTN